MLFSKDSICSLLQECIQKKDIAAGRPLHPLIIIHKLTEFTIVNDHLIRLFGATENLLEANLVFCNISDPSVFTWEAIISAHVALNQQKGAFALFKRMCEEGVNPNRCVFLTILKGCLDCEDLVQGRIIHNETIRTAFDADINVSNALIDLYAKSGSLDEAQRLFDSLCKRDVVSFGALITGYTLHGHGYLALKLFEKLFDEGQHPDKVTYLGILKACGTETAIGEGRLVHDQVIRRGFQSDVLVGSTLLDMYARSGSLDEARKVFDGLDHPTIVSWGALIAGYVQHGFREAALKLYEDMLGTGTKPDKVALMCTLKACGSCTFIEQARLLHDHVIKNGFMKDAAIGSTLIEMYASCGVLNEAQNVFACASVRDEVMWTALIAACTQHGHGDVALEIFQEMQKSDRHPNNPTYAVALKACGMVKSLTQGQLVHDQVVRSAAELDLVVSSAIVDMYCKCGSVQEASRVFNTAKTQDVVLWGSIISGYSQNALTLPALFLFEKMQKKGIKPSNFVFSSTLKACTDIQALEEGRSIHDQIVKSRLESDTVIGNTLVEMYSTCDNLEEAQKVFDDVVCLDKISWNCLIAGYTRHRQGAAALQLFGKMNQRGMNPDEATFSSVLKACGSMGAVTIGKLLHDLTLRVGVEGDVVVGTTLLDMYGTCGKLQEARQVFDSLLDKNAVTWCALIAGYAQHEKWQNALDCIHEMQAHGLQPDERIHTLMLTACGHLGEFDEGHIYFQSLVESGCSTLSMQNINCMIDLFGRHGRLQEAMELLKAMPGSPHLAGWMSVLTACKNFNNTNVGSHCLDQIAHFDHDLSSAFMFMSNIYADSNMSKNAANMQSLKKFANAWKTPGRACVEIGDEVRELVVGDDTCTPDSDITLKLERLMRTIEGGGYMPNLEGFVEPI